MGYLPWLHSLPKSWYLSALVPLSLPPLPRTISRVTTHLNFAYTAERLGAVCHAPSDRASVDKLTHSSR